MRALSNFRCELPRLRLSRILAKAAVVGFQASIQPYGAWGVHSYTVTPLNTLHRKARDWLLCSSHDGKAVLHIPRRYGHGLPSETLEQQLPQHHALLAHKLGSYRGSQGQFPGLQ